MGRTKHKQVEIQWGDLRAKVDKKLAPLILALWKAGIITTNSCQDNFPGIAWIEFLTARDAKKFLNLVATYPEQDELHLVNDRMYVGDEPFWETLYGRVTGCGSNDDWEYNLNLYNRGVDEEIVGDEVKETCVGPSDFEFYVSVRFSKTDLLLILERIQSPVSASSKRFPELEAKLLSLGGSRVIHRSEPQVDILLERGRLFGRKGRKRLRGELHRCHQNAALHYAQHHSLGYGGNCEIVTGYGLYDDGRWVQHSWLWDGTNVIETNTNPLRYFGVILNPFESSVFVFSEVVSKLPGFGHW